MEPTIPEKDRKILLSNDGVITFLTVGLIILKLIKEKQLNDRKASVLIGSLLDRSSPSYRMYLEQLQAMLDAWNDEGGRDTSPEHLADEFMKTDFARSIMDELDEIKVYGDEECQSLSA